MCVSIKHVTFSCCHRSACMHAWLSRSDCCPSPFFNFHTHKKYCIESHEYHCLVEIYFEHDYWISYFKTNSTWHYTAPQVTSVCNQHDTRQVKSLQAQQARDPDSIDAAQRIKLGRKQNLVVRGAGVRVGFQDRQKEGRSRSMLACFS